MIRNYLFWCIVLCPLFTVCADEPVNFNRDIRPLLATHCLNCHGPDSETRESGFRLDSFESATGEADSGEIPIVPNRPDSSELLRRIALPKDDDERMPPSGKGLSGEDVKKIRSWIEQGASFETHWAFVKPKVVALPKVKDLGWTQNGIDRFVLKKLESRAIQPNPAADRYRIVRRVYLDLTGVPPTIDEAEQYIADSAPNAYEKMVERALAAPKFGERWARIWLDLARYADSQGYAQDSPRRIYRYRDWVIDAINSNLPFDQFTIDQIAGDMLENATDEQILATAFHRNTMTNSEGGTDDEEFRNAAVVDRVNTTMQVWMGMTMGCAQCHTHKYDPISQEEFFQVFALLNQTEDADRGNEAPLFSETSATRLRQRKQLEKQIADLQSIITKKPKTKKPSVAINQGKLQTRFVRVQGIGKMFLHLAEIEVFDGQNKNVATSGKAKQSSTAFGGPAKNGNDGKTDGDFAKNSVTHTAEENDPWWEIDLGSAKSINKVVVWNRTDNEGVRVRLKQFRVILMDEKRTPIWTSSTKEIPNPSKAFDVPEDAKMISQTDRKQLLALLNGGEAGLSADEKKLKQLQANLNKLGPDVTTPIMKQLPIAKHRKTQIHVRGNFRQKGNEVKPGVPQVFHGLQKRGEMPDRLDFARWLISEENPVTARVIVNRFWENLFGIGIVETSEDFGTQGDLPSHPELLDYFAVEFMKNDWDVKWLMKTIVCSATYRQSSKVTPQIEKLDPKNRLLARGPRTRLSAEMIRDQALFVSGTLSTKMNGPSVRPPRPKLGLRAAFGGSTDWDPSPGEDSYRRGLYTTWRRTSPYPSMTTFDAPSREFCTLRRNKTNTPLQALVTLNDPVFVNAARNLAKLTLRVSPEDETRLAYLFRRVLVRPANEKELKFLQAILGRIKTNLDVNKANELAGMTKVDGVSNEEFASWIVICNVILNLDETLARP